MFRQGLAELSKWVGRGPVRSSLLAVGSYALTTGLGYYIGRLVTTANWLFIIVGAGLVGGLSLFLLSPQTGLTVFTLALPAAFLKVELPNYALSLSTLILFPVFLRKVAQRLVAGNVLVHKERAVAPLIVFYSCAILSVYNSVRLSSSLKFLLTWVLWTSIYLVVVHSVRERAQVRHLMGAFVVSGLLVSGLAMGEFLLFGITRPEGLASTLGNRNAVGSYMASAIPMALALALDTRSRLRRVALWATIVLLGAVLLITLSRGAWLSLAVASLFFIRRKQVWVVAAGAAIVAFVLAGPDILIRIGIPYGDFARAERAIDETRFSDESRAAMFRIGTEMLQEHPITGVGIGTFADRAAMQPIKVGDVELGISAAHNTYFAVLVETGYFGLTVFLAIFAVLFWEIGSGWRRSRGSADRVMMEGLLASAVSIMVYALTADALNTSHHWFVLALAMAGARTVLRGSQATHPLPEMVPALGWNLQPQDAETE